jgi:superfamily II DNA or RNA helicase
MLPKVSKNVNAVNAVNAVNPVNVDNLVAGNKRDTIRENSYLGKRGYTILKSVLTKTEEEQLKDECTLIPFTGSYAGANTSDTKIFVYRESEKKIYVPRFYGIEKYGLPEKTEICEGVEMNCPFHGSLRENQKPIVDVYLKHLQNGNNGSILEAPCAAGKTVMGIYIASVLKKKTLILVHKEFLMNQWIERMQTFLPTAKIGIIQADKYDVEGKDIVLGMIQTMCRKDYNLDEFGLTIIDEVHRIGSEEFSKTLLKVSTHYMLGISATVERKDKLTKILYMFIGPKIYTSEREKADSVIVKGIKYTTKDDDFNETEYDYRGNPKYSTMISKLCSYIPRCNFVIQILRDLIQNNKDGQIIVLCHNICLLTYLYDEVTREKFATCGYYKGGMKKKQLKDSEDKQIVLGSFAMASEGLDIPTLSTLVFATPKTDIIQCVGRILRVKHSNPIVVDIIDSHQLFKNQWSKRKAYYRKCNYTILEGDSVNTCQPPIRKTKTTNNKLKPSLLSNCTSKDESDEDDGDEDEEEEEEEEEEETNNNVCNVFDD